MPAIAAPPVLDILLADLALLACPGGAERFAFELIGTLDERHRVRALVAGRADRVATAAALAPGVEVTAALADRGSDDDGWRSRLRRSELVRERVRELIERDPPDVVLSHLDAAGGALAAARDTGTPSVLLLAGYNVLGEGPRGAAPSGGGVELIAHRHMRALQDAALDSASFVVAPSRAIARACERTCGRRAEVIAPVVRTPARARASADGRVVLASALWTEQKGVELVAPIASELGHRNVLVQAPNGYPDTHRAPLEGLPNVTLRERPARIESVLDGASVVLVPAQRPEAFGRVALEAMAAGVPVLASASGGLAEIVPEGQLVRDWRCPEAWAAAVRALEDPGEWECSRRRGIAAAARVLAADGPARIELLLHRAAAGRARQFAA